MGETDRDLPEGWVVESPAGPAAMASADVPFSERDRARAIWAGTKEGIGATWPIAAGLVGAAALPAGAVMSSAKWLTRPTVAGTIGAVAGGVKGYQRGGAFSGIEGAIRGGLEGAAGGGLLHGMGGALQTLGIAAGPTMTVAGQRVAASSLGPLAKALVLTPDRAAQLARLEAMASGAGTPLGSTGSAATAARAALLRLLQE